MKIDIIIKKTPQQKQTNKKQQKNKHTRTNTHRNVKVPRIYIENYTMYTVHRTIQIILLHPDVYAIMLTLSTLLFHFDHIQFKKKTKTKNFLHLFHPQPSVELSRPGVTSNHYRHQRSQPSQSLTQILHPRRQLQEARIILVKVHNQVMIMSVRKIISWIWFIFFASLNQFDI